MFFHTELLRLRRDNDRAPLSICWFAGTLTMANFKNAVAKFSSRPFKKQVNEVDIFIVCQYIMDSTFGTDEIPRFSLYLQSQLAFGAVTIFSLQVEYCLDDGEKLILSFYNKPKKIGAKTQVVRATDFDPEIDLQELFSEANFSSVQFPNTFPQDENLLDEPVLKLQENNAYDGFWEGLNFSPRKIGDPAFQLEPPTNFGEFNEESINHNQELIDHQIVMKTPPQNKYKETITPVRMKIYAGRKRRENITPVHFKPAEAAESPVTPQNMPIQDGSSTSERQASSADGIEAIVPTDTIYHATNNIDIESPVDNQRVISDDSEMKNLRDGSSTIPNKKHSIIISGSKYQIIEDNIQMESDEQPISTSSDSQPNVELGHSDLLEDPFKNWKLKPLIKPKKQKGTKIKDGNGPIDIPKSYTNMTVKRKTMIKPVQKEDSTHVPYQAPLGFRANCPKDLFKKMLDDYKLASADKKKEKPSENRRQKVEIRRRSEEFEKRISRFKTPWGPEISVNEKISDETSRNLVESDQSPKQLEQSVEPLELLQQSDKTSKNIQIPEVEPAEDLYSTGNLAQLDFNENASAIMNDPGPALNSNMEEAAVSQDTSSILQENVTIIPQREHHKELSIQDTLEKAQLLSQKENPVNLEDLILKNTIQDKKNSYPEVRNTITQTFINLLALHADDKIELKQSQAYIDPIYIHVKN